MNVETVRGKGIFEIVHCPFEMPCTQLAPATRPIRLALMVQCSSALKRTMYDIKNFFCLNFILISRVKYIFSRDMFCLYHFRAKIHGVKYYLKLTSLPMKCQNCYHNKSFILGGRVIAKVSETPFIEKEAKLMYDGMSTVLSSSHLLQNVSIYEIQPGVCGYKFTLPLKPGYFWLWFFRIT